MKTYELVYCAYDDYSSYIFTNNLEKSQVGFELDVSECMKRATDRLISENKYLSFWSILDETIKDLEDNYGYKRFTPDCKIFFSGDFYPMREKEGAPLKVQLSEEEDSCIKKLLGNDYTTKIEEELDRKEKEMERAYKEKYGNT